MASVTFAYTGALQTWVVPAGVFSVTVECWGAEGGTGYEPGNSTIPGGKGGYAKGNLAVTPGETLNLYVGGTGADRVGSGGSTGGGGWNGGGDARASDGARGGGGGGASDVRLGGTALSNRKIIAGGGGGSGIIYGSYTYSFGGGDGGAATGEDAGGSSGGKGGGTSSGGAAGTGGYLGGNSTSPTSGSLGNGGHGGSSTDAATVWTGRDSSGGGGGGRYGGGGGDRYDDVSAMGQWNLSIVGGGGGGSNYVGGVTSTTSTRGVRSGHGQIKLTYSATPPNPPTNVTPAASATVSTDLPTLGATVQTHPGSSSTRQRVEWQLASDVGMTTNLRTITEPTGDQRTSGSTTEAVAGANELTQGTWYIRARSIDEYGNTSAWTAVHSFTVAHVPSTGSHAPTGGGTINFGASGDVTLSWSFSDPSPVDSQTAYEIEVSRNTDGTVLYTSGKQASTAKSQLISVDPAEKDVMLRWRVRVWDTDDVASAWSSYHLFSVADPPTVTVDLPVDASTIDNGQPTIEWTFVATGGRTQSSHRVTIRQTSDNELVYDSGSISGSASTHTPPSPVLENATEYTVTVSVTGSEGLQGSGSSTFDTAWTAPDQPPIIAYDLSPSAGYVLLQWDNNTADAEFVRYNLYRRKEGDLTWVKIYEISDVQGNYEYRDWATQIGTTYEYAVSQVANRFGANVESTRSAEVAVVTPESEKYWLVVPDDPSQNLMLQYVTGDDFTEEYEQESMTVVGRGRHVDEGERLGFSGSLSAELRNIVNGPTAREQRLLLEDMKAQRKAVYLRNPFGDLWLVAIGNVGVSRVSGVGRNEYVDVSIPYLEVG